MNLSSNAQSLVFQHVQIGWGTLPAIADISFSVPAGQFIALTGPSGCGKTSLLNVAAGLLKPLSGQVFCSGEEIRSINSNAAYLFQQDALLPWKNVLQNVMLGPCLRGMPAVQAGRLALEWIERVGMRGFQDRYPAQLSGGQRKRIALAQALIIRLPILLMDEPFSALDVQTRLLMEAELLTLWKSLGATVLFVTHDLEEAISMADRVLLLSAGPSSRLRSDYPVDFPRPRNLAEIRFMPEFIELHQRMWGELKEEVTASYARSRSPV